MRNSRARSLSTWRIHDRWLWEKPWMNRISGPDGLPHSCAKMVRPSGVFTLIGLCFGCCPRPGCAIATRNAATVNLARRLPGKDIVIATPLIESDRRERQKPREGQEQRQHWPRRNHERISLDSSGGMYA